MPNSVIVLLFLLFCVVIAVGILAFDYIVDYVYKESETEPSNCLDKNDDGSSGGAGSDPIQVTEYFPPDPKPKKKSKKKTKKTKKTK